MKYSWKNREEIREYATNHYFERVIKNVKRYGGSRSEDGVRASAKYKYLGRQKQKEVREGNRMWYEPIEGEYECGNAINVIKDS